MTPTDPTPLSAEELATLRQQHRFSMDHNKSREVLAEVLSEELAIPTMLDVDFADDTAGAILDNLNERGYTVATLAARELNVERLARAIHRWHNPSLSECSDPMGKHGQAAERIAAAYAALSETSHD